MKILCLDQATKVTGYSIWVDGKLKKYGVLTPKVSKDAPYIERLTAMGNAIESTIIKTKPDAVCIEDVQYQSNQRTFKILAQLQGYIFAILDRIKLPFVVVEPSCWKSFAGIKARKREEQKAQTMEFVRKQYKTKQLSEDEADAIGIGHWAVSNIMIERTKG